MLLDASDGHSLRWELWRLIIRTKILCCFCKVDLDESERGEWKSWLKVNIQKMKIMASDPITSWEIDGETVETVSDFYFGGLQNHCRW